MPIHFHFKNMYIILDNIFDNKTFVNGRNSFETFLDNKPKNERFTYQTTGRCIQNVHTINSALYQIYIETSQQYDTNSIPSEETSSILLWRYILWKPNNWINHELFTGKNNTLNHYACQIGKGPSQFHITVLHLSKLRTEMMKLLTFLKE